MARSSAVIVRLARRATLAAMPFTLGACTLVGGVPPAPAAPVGAPVTRPASAPTPSTREGATAADMIAAGVVDVALEAIGTPYEWGGTDANGFDCSGLIQFAYGRYGIPIPRTSQSQMRAGRRVEPTLRVLRPGDVLGFSDGRSGKTSHVGLYIGDAEFIHSSSSGVRVSSLRNPYWTGVLVGARRFLAREARPTG